MEVFAGWDEAVAVVQKREARKHSRPDPGRHRKPIYGMPGAELPEPPGGG